VRGDTDRIDTDVAVDGVLRNIDHVAVIEARTALANAAERAVTSLTDFEAAVRRLGDNLPPASCRTRSR
jgi:hypothetical protein